MLKLVMATVTTLDEAAPLVVMAALLEGSAGVTQASALVSVGDTVAVDNHDGYLRCGPPYLGMRSI